MANYLQFITPSGENVQFTLTAQADGSSVLRSQNFTTASSATQIFLKVFATTDPGTSLQPNELVEGTLYDIEAFEDAGLTIAAEISSWTGSGVEFIGFTFEVDRRPLYQAGLATQTTTYQNIKAGTPTFGVNQQDYRKTGSTGANTTSASNGRLAWIEDKVLHTCDDTYSGNFERFHFTNIAGHTSINKGNQQPHYSSGAYQSLNLPKAKYFTELSGTVANEAALPTASSSFNNEYYRTTDNDHLFCCVNSGGTYSWQDMGEADGFNTNRPYFLMDSPFTDTGLTSGTLGDSVDAWTEALTQFRAAATPTDLEITSYQGYRPVFNDSTGYVPFDHQAEQVISLSKQSSSSTEPSWQGQNNGDPAYCPEPGWDGSDSDVWVPRFASYFDKEIAGIESLGFDGIGLDTGTRVWDNAEGRANGSFSSQPADGTGSSGIVDYFNGFGIKPVFEAVGLNTWSGAGGPYPASDSRYTAAAYWAYFGSWWGWHDGTTEYSGSGGTLYYNNGTQVVGDPAQSGAAFDPANSEVHCIYQWPSTSGSSAASQSTNLVGWILENQGLEELKQSMFDFHAAGLVVSAAGSADNFTAHSSTPNAGVVFDSADFYNYVMDLYNGTATRPVILPPAPPAVTINSTTPPEADAPEQGTAMSVDASAIGSPPPSMSYKFMNLVTQATLQDGASNTYTPQAGDVGQFIKVEVTATNGSGSDTVTVAWQQVVTATSVFVKYLKNGTPTGPEPRAQTTGLWFKFENSAAGPAQYLIGDATTAVNFTSNTNLVPTDSPSPLANGACVKLAKSGGSATINAPSKLKITFFEPGTSNERHPTITSTSWTLTSGNYFFVFGDDDVIKANIDDGGAWGWTDGDDVVFELIQ